MLDQLLGAAMQQADVRVDALDDLAVELQHEPQHAVGRGMLRPEVDVEVADFGFWHWVAREIAVGAAVGSGVESAVASRQSTVARRLESVVAVTGSGRSIFRPFTVRHTVDAQSIEANLSAKTGASRALERALSNARN